VTTIYGFTLLFNCKAIFTRAIGRKPADRTLIRSQVEIGEGNCHTQFHLPYRLGDFIFAARFFSLSRAARAQLSDAMAGAAGNMVG
jgi:hypothetical protein